MELLQENGIETRPGFYPFRVMPPYCSQPLPVAADISGKIVCLPSFGSSIGISKTPYEILTRP